LHGKQTGAKRLVFTGPGHSARGLAKAAQQLGVDAIRIEAVPRKLDAEHRH
jgi:hypothetical protein